MNKKASANGYEGSIRIIGGKWRGRALAVPNQDTLRPTPNRVRETLFNWLQNDIVEKRCLDLFAGTGALGFEALSRGARHVTFVELNPQVVKSLEQSLIQLDAMEYGELIQKDAIQYLQSLPEQVVPMDIIFCDPPFRSALLDTSLICLADSPLVGPQTLLYIESAYPLNDQSLPPHWELLKQKQASQVFYHLIRGGA